MITAVWVLYHWHIVFRSVVRLLGLIAILGFVGMTLSACTEKAQPVNVHEADTRPAPQDPQPVDPEQTPFELSAAVQSKFNSSKDALVEVLVPLANQVFSQERITKATLRQSESTRDDLINLNTMVLRLDKSQHSRVEFKRIIDLYVATLNFECGQILSSCRGLSYLALAGNSSQVIKLAALMRTKETPRLLLFAVELSNNSQDLELLQLVLEKVPAGIPGQSEQIREATRSFLESALAVAERSFTEPSQLRAFLTSIHAWNLASGLEWQLGEGAKQNLWSMLARARMIYDGKGHLHASVQEAIRKINAQPDSLAQQQEELRRTKLFYPEAIGARYVTKFDELFFLVDQVYNRRMLPRAATDIFLNTDRSAKDMADMIEDYARMRFAFALRNASLKAKEIFTANVATEQLFRHSLNEAPTIRRIWDHVEQSVAILRTLTAMTVAARPDGAVHADRLRKMLDSFAPTVSMVSIYPHMMLMFHYLSKKRFELRMPMVGYVSSGELMSFLFYGSFPPLLPYTDSGAALNHFELTYAFDMAVRTNLFPIVGVNVDDFMSDTIARITEARTQDVENNLNLISKRFQESPHMPNFNAICHELKTGTPAPRMLNLDDLKTSPYYGNMIKDVFTGINSRGGSMSADQGSLFVQEMGLFYADTDFNETMERVRLDLSQWIKLGEAMLFSYANYLAKYEKASADQISTKTAKLTSQLSRLKALRQRAIQLNAQWNERFGECYVKAGLKDWDYKDKLFRAEEQYFRQAHRDIKRLRTSGVSHELRQNLIQSYKFTGLPSNFQGQDIISAEGYRVYQADFLIRVGRYLTHGLKTETATIAPIAPHLTINYGSKLNLDNPIIREGLSEFIAFTENENDFVANAMRILNRNADHMHHWMLLSGARVSTWTLLLKNMITLYRIENESGQTQHSITPEKILKMHEEYLKFTKLDKDDRWLMETMHQANRLELTFFHNRLLYYSSSGGKMTLQDYWGLYDLPVRLMNRDRLGWDHDYELNEVPPDSVELLLRPRRWGYREMGTLYHSVRSSWVRGVPLIPYNADLDRKLDARVTDFVRTETAAVRTFNAFTRDYANEAGLRPIATRPRADITVDISITSPMLTPELLDSWEADQKSFQRETHSCYVQACEDFR